MSFEIFEIILRSLAFDCRLLYLGKPWHSLRHYWDLVWKAFLRRNISEAGDVCKVLKSLVFWFLISHAPATSQSNSKHSRCTEVMIWAWRWNDSCKRRYMQVAAVSQGPWASGSWRLWASVSLTAVNPGARRRAPILLLWQSLSYTSTLTFISSSLSLSLPQMTRPIQVKPADSESRGGKEISFLSHFITPHSFIFSSLLTHFLFRSLCAGDISFDWKCSHSVWGPTHAIYLIRFTSLLGFQETCVGWIWFPT